MKTETNGPSRARHVEEGRFTASKASNGGGVENVACGSQDGKTRILDQGPATCSILIGLGILGGLYLGR
jgi:hypothetical protein